MISFIKKPNLPKGKVASVICGNLCNELNDYLNNLGIERFVIEPNNSVDPAVKFHADMAALHLGANVVIVDKKQKRLVEQLNQKQIIVKETNTEIAGEYPKDIALNFTLINNTAIGNFKYADKVLLDSLKILQQINVKQGYCKCSCLVVSENALITDDESVFKKAQENGIDSLLISKGDVTLDGHNYGFIGGASFKLSNKDILFFGDITKHKDYKKIAAFIEKHGCKIKYLDFPLTDFGGIIPITEKAP